MISVVIPTLNAETDLAATLSALVPAAVDGLVREVIVVDGGSTDGTAKIADAAGVTFIVCAQGRGQQLQAGASAARFPWLLFLHADTVLAPEWIREVAQLMEPVESGRRQRTAAAFRFALDDVGLAPRLLETLVGLRCLVLRMPYGDQGLLMPRSLYDSIGGYRPLPLMEDVDIVRRLGRSRVRMLRTPALTNARRYRNDGYLRRILRNQLCLALYLTGAPMERILSIYGHTGAKPRR